MSVFIKIANCETGGGCWGKINQAHALLWDVNLAFLISRSLADLFQISSPLVFRIVILIHFFVVGICMP